MALQAVGAIGPDVVQPRADRSCFQEIIELVKKVVTAVADFFKMVGEFFLNVFRFLFCINENPAPEWQPEPNRDPVVDLWQPDPDPWNPGPVANLWQPDPEPLDQNPVVDLFGPARNDIPNDIPVDLEALKESLRTGIGNPPISSRMTPEHFSELCAGYPIHVTIKKGDDLILREERVQEAQMIAPILEQLKRDVAQREGPEEAAEVKPEIDFPPERMRIAEWAKRWAQARRINADPTHPYFEIIQAAFQNRTQIPGGPQSSADYRTYSPPNRSYWSNTNQFTYAIMSLIGFQELSRPENIALFHKLDNWSLQNGQNPAYEYASALSNIFTYPKAFGGAIDVRQKLQNGLGAAWGAYERAKSSGQIAAFFRNCFDNSECFDARVMKFQEFSLQHMDPRFEDFNPKIVHRDPTDRKVTRHAAAFYHRQIDQYVKEHPEAGLTYETFKEQVDNGEDNDDVNTFEDSYYTRDRFAQYLQENDQPIRERTEAPRELPRINGVRFNPDIPFLIIDDVAAIPEAHRVVNHWVALRDRFTWYKARVDRVDPNRIILDLRGDPIEEDNWQRILNAAYMMMPPDMDEIEF